MAAGSMPGLATAAEGKCPGGWFGVQAIVTRISPANSVVQHRSAHGSVPRRAQTIPVTVTRVQSRDVPYEIEATGTVEPQQTVKVLAQVGGIIERQVRVRCTTKAAFVAAMVARRNIVFNGKISTWTATIQQIRTTAPRMAYGIRPRGRPGEMWRALKGSLTLETAI